jgi:5-formyltetrahydrofolate cyclo-ligase
MTKTELRRQMRQRLAGIPPEERTAAGADIARLVWTVPEIAAARVLLLYAALPEEVPTAAIALEAWQREITVLYPKVGGNEDTLSLYEVCSLAELQPGSYGISEPDPARCPMAEPASVEAALIPGLAWDRQGRRLGRGAGYYDRLLAQPGFRAFRCGLFFAAQEVAHIPADPWDVPLDAVISEREVWRA